MCHSNHFARGAQGGGAAFEKPGSYYNKFRGGGWYRRPKYNVPINVVDNETHFEVHVYALGFAKENIRISVQDDILYISGTRTIDESNPPNFSMQEYPVKSFERTLALNGQVDKAGISARQLEGVLIIHLPKSADARQPAQDVKIEE
jgi:HSP20 family protein